jgi:hypothetical protein
MNAIVDKSAVNAEDYENVIREFAPRGALRREQRLERKDEAAAEQINAVIKRVAGASFDEIDRVIAALQMMKDTLRQEGERVQREIVGYASLSHSAATSMQVIEESLRQWKPGRLRAEPT